jgi:hypothetical protein
MADVRNGDFQFRPLAATTLYVMLGPIVWAVDFTIIYGAHAALCAPGVFANPPRDAAIAWWIVMATTMVASVILGVGILAFSPQRGRARKMAEPQTRTPLADRGLSVAPKWPPDVPLLRGLAELLSILALIGVIWLGVAALLVDPCLQLR